MINNRKVLTVDGVLFHKMNIYRHRSQCVACVHKNYPDKSTLNQREKYFFPVRPSLLLIAPELQG